MSGESYRTEAESAMRGADVTQEGLFIVKKTAYEINAGDWSSDVCSSDLSRAVSSSFQVAASVLRDVRGVHAPDFGARRFRPAPECGAAPGCRDW